MTNSDKPLKWVGAARKEVQAMPEDARHLAGRDLRRVQRGMMPIDWKPMEQVGPGSVEIRIRTSKGGTVHHRVMYVAKFPEAVYVLHAFEKKTARTSPHNIEVAARRYRELLKWRQSLNNPGKDPR
ncbi:MAG TPA: type II toxin-antitoxin system RelE/ParE family toxin [Longimicrobium sp.]|nr:type II toxin-antitoxin system RelE/ParE family toxin [Longimicrobium sp.]